MKISSHLCYFIFGMTSSEAAPLVAWNLNPKDLSRSTYPWWKLARFKSNK